MLRGSTARLACALQLPLSPWQVGCLAGCVAPTCLLLRRRGRGLPRLDGRASLAVLSPSFDGVASTPSRRRPDLTALPRPHLSSTSRPQWLRLRGRPPLVLLSAPVLVAPPSTYLSFLRLELSWLLSSNRRPSLLRLALLCPVLRPSLVAGSTGRAGADVGEGGLSRLTSLPPWRGRLPLSLLPPPSNLPLLTVRSATLASRLSRRRTEGRCHPAFRLLLFPPFHLSPPLPATPSRPVVGVRARLRSPTLLQRRRRCHRVAPPSGAERASLAKPQSARVPLVHPAPRLSAARGSAPSMLPTSLPPVLSLRLLLVSSRRPCPLPT